MMTSLACMCCASFCTVCARDIALAWSQRLKNRIEPLHCLVGSANHHAIAAIEAPYSAAGSDVYVVNAFAFKLTRPAYIILEIGIAAVNDDVAGLHVLRELLHGLFGGATRWHHNPPRARRRELCDQIF